MPSAHSVENNFDLAPIAGFYYRGRAIELEKGIREEHTVSSQLTLRSQSHAETTGDYVSMSLTLTTFPTILTTDPAEETEGSQ